MLKHHIVAEELPEDFGALVDHRGEGNGVHDAAHAMSARMVECEGERSQRLAAAGRHCEREKPSRFGRFAAHMRQHALTKTIDWRLSPKRGFAREFRVGPLDEAGQDRLELRPFPVRGDALDPIVEGLGVLEIGIHQAGKQHAPKE